MKVNILEAHDRLLHFKKEQEVNVFNGVEECLKTNPNCLGMQQYFPWVYIFCHPRTAEDGVTKRMLFQPRLVKPRAQTNSYLFRVLSNTDIVETIWLLPPRELWPQFDKGKVTESEDVRISIKNFLCYREMLEAPHKDDWDEERIRQRLKWIQDEKTRLKPAILAEFPSVPVKQVDTPPTNPSSGLSAV